MANLSNTQDLLNSNESDRNHYRLVEKYSEPIISESLTATRATPLNSPGDDWASLTRDLIDTLPRVWSRGLLYLLIGFAAIVIPWTMLARVDQTGSARGRLEPKGRALRLDAPVAGTVAAINVEEGQLVEAGQVLLKFESEEAQAELQQAQIQLEGQKDRKTQLEFIKTQLESAVRTQQLQSQAQESEQLAQLDQIQRRLNSSRQVYAVERDRLALAQNEVQRHRYLLQEGVISRSRLEELEGARLERQGLLEQAQSGIQQAQTELEKQQSTYERTLRTGELAVLESQNQIEELEAQILEVQTEIAQTQKQIQALQFQLRQKVLYAPTDGTVFQLAINNAGTVLQPGQEIAQIAPATAPLILRAQMPSQESGFLQVGMPVNLKFDAYPFQDYGVVQGRLRWISPDSKVVETDQGRTEVFELEIELDQPYIQDRTKQIALTPGQTATAEVIVRQRRIIDLLLDPFKKLQKGGLEL